MNFTLSEFEELIEKFKFILGKFETTEDKNISAFRHKLFLANGDVINYSIPINAIPHLLGIKTDYLQASGVYGNCKNGIDIMKKLCDDYFSIYQKVKSGIISFDNIFSKYVKEKVSSVLTNLYIDENQTEFVCKYDSEKSYENADVSQKFDYAIVRKINDKIGIICLVKKENYYVPMSNRIYNNIEEAESFLSEILKNQTITLLQGHQTINFYTNYNKKGILILNAKIDKANRLKFYRDKFNAVIDITSDYEYSLNSLANRREERNYNNNFIELISQSILEGKIIKPDENEESSLLQIVDAFNDYLCKGSNNDSNIEYSKAIAELKRLKSQITELASENNELKFKLESAASLNNELTEKNNDLNDRQNQIIKILLPKKEC